MGIEIELTEKIYREAKRACGQAVGTEYPNFDRADVIKTTDDIYVGKIGDLVFEEYLNINGFKKNVDYVTSEGPHIWDLRFLSSGITVDIRTMQTLRQPTADWYFGYSVNANPEQKDFIVICAVNFEFGYASILGYISGKRVTTYPKTWYNTGTGHRYRVENYDIPMKDLAQNIPRLLNFLKTGRLVRKS